MIIRVREFKIGEAPYAVRQRYCDGDLRPGDKHEAHSVAVYEGRSSFLIVEGKDRDRTCWYPAWFFDVVDPQCADDWILMTFREEPSLVIGPPCVAASIENYVAIASCEYPQYGQFWERLRQRTPKEPDDES